MNKTGISGGLINLNSFISQEDRDSNIRIASSSLFRSAATKEGLQSLYADSEEILKKYKDFDIAKAMADQKGKFLWVRARAIDADTVNTNGDFFSKEELLAEVEHKGEKIPAYKTFEGVPIYTNHKNDDIEEAKGKVVYAEWDDDNNCVWTTFFVDEEAYPNIARGIRQGYMSDVSMGCSVKSGICSICGNEAETEKQYCKHMEKYKGKTWPDTGDKAYEKNYGLKFIELSVVGDGAFDTCEISEIYDVEEVLEKALDLKKRASAIYNDILVASSILPANCDDRWAYENCLRQVAATSRDVVRLAQSAGTLVGGQLLASEGAGKNTTVGNILQFLGIDPSAGLNILDMLNLALNFLEVTIMNLFARKDNVDLSHVGKITKSMADLQSTMQDMIDDGVEVQQGAGAQPGVPLNGQQPQQIQQPQQPLQEPVQLPGQAQAAGNVGQDYIAPGSVGRGIGVGAMPTQNQLFFPNSPIGGGVVANNKRKKPLVLWASPDKNKREVYASTNTRKVTSREVNGSLLKLGENLASFADSLGITMFKQGSPLEPNNIESKSKKKTSGGKNMDDIFEKFKLNRQLKEAALVSVDFNVDDNAKENRITLSSDGSIKAFHNGIRLAWEPELTDDQIDALGNNKEAEVAAELLRNFKRALSENKVIEAWKEPTTSDTVMEEQLSSLHKGTDKEVKELLLDGKAGEYGRKGEDDRVREQTLEKSRKGTPEIGKVREQLLEEDAGLYGWNPEKDEVKEALLEDARKTIPEEVIELRLKSVRAESGKSDTVQVVNAAVNALSDTVLAAVVTPKEVIEYAIKLSERDDLDILVALASMGNEHREIVASRREFHDSKSPIILGAALFNALGRRVSENINAADLSEALSIVIKEAKIEQSVARLAKEKKNNTSEITSTGKRISKEDKIRAALAIQNQEDSGLAKEHLKAAISAFASSSIDTTACPKEVIAAVSSMDEDTLLMETEMARTASAVESRIKDRERREFWNRTASKQDVCENIVGWMADYADSYKIDNTASIVKAVKRVAESPDVAENLTTKMINFRLSSIEVTDEKTTTKRIVCRIEDLGGLDVKSETFEDDFRSKAIEILGNAGWTVDPQTFTLSDLNVTASGDITATVTSRMSKAFKVDDTSTSNPSAMAPMDSDIVSSSPAPLDAEGGDSMSPEGGELAGITPQPYEENDVVMTAAAKSARKARRDDILKRYAQMPGMSPMSPPGGAMGMAGGAPGTTPSPLDGALGANADQGVSALVGNEDVDQDGQPDDLLGEDKGGAKKPWGTVCPQCGSDNVDVANGEGNCRDCNAQLEYTFTVNVKPGNDETKESGPGAEEPPSPFGEDLGLGAATAPQPAAGAPLGGGAAAPAPPTPGVMAQASWNVDSDVFVRLASSDFDKNKELRLPVGFVCPGCGNREAIKHQNTTYCNGCGTISKSKIAQCKVDPTKIRVSIKWLS
jgi:hypothetical protein